MNDFVEFITNINTFVLLITGFSLSAILKKYLSWKKKNIEKTNYRLEVLEEGQVAILHNKIYMISLHHIDKGYVTLDDLEDLDYLFKPYKKLGGNGTAEKLYDEVQSLRKIKRDQYEYNGESRVNKGSNARIHQ